MRRQLLVTAVIVMTALGIYAAFRVVRLTIAVAHELSGATELATIAPRAQATIVLDRHGNPAFTFFTEDRIDVPLDRVSPHMRNAIVAVEDKRFYSHRGVDPIRIMGAAWQNVRARRIRQGGSTITQQLARAARLSPARTFDRKIREVMIALRLEERFDKGQILQEYLNTVYFGDGYYGVESASRGYFSKSAADLAPAEAALLAALVRSPSLDAPNVSPDRARARRNMVLRLMRAQAKLSDGELRPALDAPLPECAHATHSVRGTSESGIGEYFQEEVRRQLVQMFGGDRVLRGGLRVHTSYDPDLQQAAEIAVRARIADIVKTRRSARDLQGSLVAIDPANGDVLALVGGRSFTESSFNRATQARRQAGSAFKPIIFAAALERGYSPGSMLRDLDTPIDAADGAWLPGGEHEDEEYTLRAALKVSSNRAAAQLLQTVGLSTTVFYAHRLGIESDLPMVPSLALGTGEVTLLELTAAYGAFANKGLHAAPRLITRVDDADGTLLWTTPVEITRAISPTNAFLMSSMLSDVVSRGTATGARAAGFTLPSAGKTGTTDDYADAWFVGYTPHLVAGVWFGMDAPRPIMSRGFAGVVAVPAWAQFMKIATKGAKRDWFDVPADVEKVEICRRSGARATDACRHATELESLGVPGDPLATVDPLPAKPQEPVYGDYFPLGTIPPDLCTLHVPVPMKQGDGGIVVERTTRPDGTHGIMLRGGGF